MGGSGSQQQQQQGGAAGSGQGRYQRQGSRKEIFPNPDSIQLAGMVDQLPPLHAAEVRAAGSTIHPDLVPQYKQVGWTWACLAWGVFVCEGGAHVGSGYVVLPKSHTSTGQARCSVYGGVYHPTASCAVMLVGPGTHAHASRGTHCQPVPGAPAHVVSAAWLPAQRPPAVPMLPRDCACVLSHSTATNEAPTISRCSLLGVGCFPR